MAEDRGPRNRHFSEKNRKCHNFAEGDSLISYRVFFTNSFCFPGACLLVCVRLCFNDRLKVQKRDLSSCYIWSRSNSTRCDSVHARKRIASCSESWNSLPDVERLLTCVAGGKSLVRRASESWDTCHWHHFNGFMRDIHTLSACLLVNGSVLGELLSYFYACYY